MKIRNLYILIACLLSCYSQAQTKSFDHIIMYGQSLSIGYQAYPVISTENVAGNYMIGDQIWINYGNSKDLKDYYPLVGNIGNSHKNVENLMSRNAYITAECSLLGTVNHLQKKMEGKSFLATSCGTSGRTIEELSKESQTRTHYSDYTYALKSASMIARQKGYNLNCPAIIWMQGEFNYEESGSGLTVGSTATSDKEEYKDLLLTLKNNMQNDVMAQYSQGKKPVFITYQVGAQYTKGKTISVGMAQLEAANEEADIICAGPVYPMTDRGGHLDSNGYRWFGEMLGKVYYKTQVLGEDFKPLQPKKITKLADSKKIKIQFLVPKLPLVLDTKTVHTTVNYGFSIYKNDIKQIIYGVTVDNDCVIIDCAEKLEGRIEVVYGGESTAGHGNLRDSDDYEAFYTYEDLDRKNDDGTFFYPREVTETTLRPSYEPKDESGSIIYDKSYPLHNWSVAFYYKLDEGIDEYQVQNLDGGSSIQTDVMEQYPLFRQEKGLLLFTQSEQKDIQIEVFNLSGGLIERQTLKESIYSLSKLPKGLCVVKASDGVRSYSELVVVSDVK